MDDLSSVVRPVMCGELADALGISRARLERLLSKNDIRPACRIGRTRCYGPVQVRKLFNTLGITVSASAD